MVNVDNSGKGNCMYYAYSISLMYFLRAKSDSKVTEDIFNKLKLNKEQKSSLQALLLKEPREPFSEEAIQSIIEPVLGRAVRDLAGERTVEEFNRSPYDTPFFTAANYGMAYYIKNSLQSNSSEIANLINNDFTDHDYTDAEIYRVAGIKSSMEEFAATRIPEIIQEFDKQWAVKKIELKERGLSESDIQFHQSNLLDNIIRKETVAFFSANDSEYLNKYKQHLQKEYVWGTEETLMTLHRGIQGERMERNKEGTIDTFRDTEIVLHVHRNGTSPFFQSGSPEMILNNISNAHWTSKIPDLILSPIHSVSPPKIKSNELIASDKPADKPSDEIVIKQQNMLKILDDMKVARDNIPKDLKEYDVAKNLIIHLDAQIRTIASGQLLSKKEMAVNQIINLIETTSPKLGHYESWGTMFKNFLSAVLDCIPAFLGGKQIRSGLATWGIYSEDRRPEIIRTVERVKNTLSNAIEEQKNLIEEQTQPVEESAAQENLSQSKSLP
jgi:hypothetical protein